MNALVVEVRNTYYVLVLIYIMDMCDFPPTIMGLHCY